MLTHGYWQRVADFSHEAPVVSSGLAAGWPVDGRYSGHPGKLMSEVMCTRDGIMVAVLALSLILLSVAPCCSLSLGLAILISYSSKDRVHPLG